MLLLRMLGLFIMFSPSLCEILDVHLSFKAEAKLYRLQCDVSIAAPQNLTVNWYKKNENTNTTAFDPTTTRNTSDILEVDITREEHVAQFRCEALLDGPQGAQLPDVSQTHNLSALYTPEIRTNHSDHITVPSGGVVSLTCEADGNPLPEHQWAVNGSDLSTNSETINVTEDDGGTYSCTAMNDLGNTILNIYVHAPEGTSSPAAALPTPEKGTSPGCILTVMPSEVVVKFGDPVMINCSTSNPDIEKLGWESTVGGVSNNSTSILWKVEEVKDFNLKADCFGTPYEGEQCMKGPVIIIYKTPDFVSVSAVDHGTMKEGSEYQLRCDIYNVAPVESVTVTWYHNNKSVSTEHPKISPPPNVTPLNVSSILRVTVNKRDNGSRFTCVAELHLGPKGPKPPPSATSNSYIAVVHYKPVIGNCQPKRPVVENKFSMNDMSCAINANPQPTVQWYRDGQLINSSEPLRWNESGMYRAEVSNSMGTSSSSVNIRVEYSPRFSCKMHYEVQANDKPKTLCDPEGLPPPNITWFKNGVRMDLPQSWSKQESGNYSLKAHNEHGTAEHTFYLDVMGKTSTNLIYWVLLTLAFIFLVLFFIVTFIRKKKQGRYSFVSKSDESSIPMTTNGPKEN